jgi:hypothetical protein
MPSANSSVELEMRSGNRVVVVVDPKLGARLADFEDRSVWVIESADNRAVWQRLSFKPNSSIFKVDDSEMTVDNLKAQLDDVDLHFGSDSFPKDPYVGISVVGLALYDDVEAKLREYGFDSFLGDSEGFEADLA